MEDSVEELIKITIDKIRPFLQRDGGDVKFVAFIDGYVYVQFVGACDGCSFVNDDIGQGLEIILMEEVPGVLGVKLSSEMPK